MKKICRTLLLLIMALGIFSAANTQSASASSYHKGTPTALRGYWRTKIHKNYYNHGGHRDHWWGYFHAAIKSSNIRIDAVQGGAYGANKMSYRYAGNHTYYLKGKEEMGPGTVYTLKWKIKKLSSNKIKLVLLGNKDIKTMTYYKFSGRISKHTYYPYL
ncbi:hypothetical protein IWT25_00459 [Secundilactobacillus pentosiphilus]|uniref:Lipocalin-like domain-containing protein n=1 Tax=Secundilactobacillus pentosiphilus TaxID=1714682 RepID=A0A1Z5IU01_9LACO|nr:hypothetical protein [Secundilactobacillus pentosiphilus]GAX05156.1 hypothetical protein IWT25_00459 [Secundilactobacillus pentosiphilus]